ncbi:efflux RND transporter periplasmic adaptor subunit [Falsiroseomonas selenitidurans]|uniref:Efflux RND transporter periplasmic adaptor subunit n=1 Tax=Falsiroseomonas selenitidurans TaxID=2716335 RepID=A0ABX1E834_9PROT|nr:efflux RND transporter periplasmic adaptor subunit [Falsiroseomonas selenitidurans]NKC31672.1 efflux RND transporter periplasmic adaptor subunit [Falsiroseomonas selenitidurans]
MDDGSTLRQPPRAGLSRVEPTPPRPRRRNGRRGLLLVAACLAASLAWRYGVPARAEAIEVRAAPFTRTVTGPALLDALVKVEVGARIAGRIAELPAEEGDQVAAGARLVRLDAGDAAHLLAQAEAQTAAARRAVTEAEADRDAAEAALVRARADFRRKEELLPRGATTRAEFDAARSTLDQATANADRARSAVMRARDQLYAAEAGARGTGVRLGDTLIAAPVAGIITDRLQSVGDVVGAGTPILRLVDPASLVLTARFDESVMSQVAPGQAAELRYISYPGRVFHGTVLRLGRSVDTTTREFTVEVALAEPPPHWAIGQRAMVTLATGTAPATITVPQDALAPRGGQAGLWVAEGGHRARWRRVQLGAAADGRIEVTEGLREGEVVLRRPWRPYAFKPVTPVMS